MTSLPISIRRAARVIAGAILLGRCLRAAAPACAHQVNISTARVEVRPQRVVAVEVALKGSDVDRVAGTHVFDEQTGTVDAAKVAAAAGADRRLCRRACLRHRRRWRALRCRRSGGDGRRRRRHHPQYLFLRQGRRRPRLPLDGADRVQQLGPPGGAARRPARTPRRRCSTIPTPRWRSRCRRRRSCR